MDALFIVLLLTTLTLLAIYYYVPVTQTMVPVYTSSVRGNYGGSTPPPPPPPYPSGDGGGGSEGAGDEGGEDEEGEEGEEVEAEGELNTEALEDGDEETGETAQELRKKFKRFTTGKRFAVSARPPAFKAGNQFKAKKFTNSAVTDPLTAAELTKLKLMDNTKLCAPQDSRVWKVLGIDASQLEPRPENKFKPLKFTKAAKFARRKKFTGAIVCTKDKLTPEQLKAAGQKTQQLVISRPKTGSKPTKKLTR